MTARDLQVLRLVAKGRLAKEVAGELGISERMTEYHLLRARQHFGARNTVDAVTRLLTQKRTRKAELVAKVVPAQELWGADSDI